MKQYVHAYMFNRSPQEISSRISHTLEENPTWSVQTVSMTTYDSATGRIFEAVVVFNR